MPKTSKSKSGKQKDFQKPKLKVGKKKPTPSNLTNTSFKSKQISILHQNLQQVEPSTSNQFSHHLSQLTHKSDLHRKESLTFLVSILSKDPDSILVPVSIILPKILPLLLDLSTPIRTKALEFLCHLPIQSINSNMETINLYCRTALTHLSTKIQLTGCDTLEWLLNTSGLDLVTSPGGWLQILKSLTTVLGWKGLYDHSKLKKGWQKTNAAVEKRGEDEEKLKVRQLQVIALLLKVALTQKEDNSHSRWQQRIQIDWNHHLWQHYEINTLRNPYGHLNLFNTSRNEDEDQYLDQEERLRVFLDTSRYDDVKLGVELFKGYGGGIGRSAHSVDKVLQMIPQKSS